MTVRPADRLAWSQLSGATPNLVYSRGVKNRIAAIALLSVVVSCGAASAPEATTETPPTTTTDAPLPSTTTTRVPAPASTTAPTTTQVTTTTLSPFARPAWLGTRLLPLREDGFGEVVPTPEELIDRRFETLDLLPPPPDEEFVWTLGPVPEDVLVRSTWREDCPVEVAELAYITVSHFGFDGAFHTGEMIINAAVAEDIVEVFRELHAARFPIEQMRVIRQEEVDAHPTGDWNETTSFVCREAVGSTRWSNHAFGLAIDINPFHNPYLKGDLVLPELASVYVDRDEVRPGMIVPDDAVTTAFAAIGWSWGGEWNTLKDWMHFSLPGD